MTDLGRVMVETYADGRWVHAGVYWRRLGIGRFVYDPEYLAMPGAFALDPIHLALSERVHEHALDQGVFGAFQDSGVLRWARLVGRLPQREPSDAEIHESLVEGSANAGGAIRFRYPGHRQAPGAEPSAPSLAEIAGLANRAATELRSRLVGFVSCEGEECLAKLAAPQELADVPRVEFAVQRLAVQAGIEVPTSHLSTEPAAALLIARFDRWPDGRRRHFLTAGTLLGLERWDAGPGAQRQTRIDLYRQIADLVATWSDDPAQDLEQLFRRMVFNAGIGNRDDHPFNHGFLGGSLGGRYRLAPAFDLGLTPQIEDPRQGWVRPLADSRQDLLASCEAFGLGADRATEILDRVAEVIAGAPDCLDAVGLTAHDQAWVGRIVGSARRALESTAWDTGPSEITASGASSRDSAPSI